MKVSIVFSIAITACTANPVLAQGDQHANENSLDALVVRLRGSDEEDSEAAATSLRRLGPKAAPAVPALVKALGDPDQGVRANAAICLGFIGHQAKAAVPALSRLLMDQNEMDTVRSWAALSLGRIGPDALPILIEALKPGSDVFVRGAAANAVGKMGPKAEPAIPQLLVALADQEERIWSNAVETLVAIGRAALPPLRHAVEGKDPRIRGHAGRAVLNLQPEDLPTIRTMIKDLKHPDPEIRRNAILVLEHATPDASTETVPAFAESLKDLDAFVREVAARNLYGIGPRAQTAMPSLIAAMRDPQAEVRGYSALALGKIGAKSATALAALIRGIDDEEEDVRIVVVRALGSIGPDAASAAPKLKAVLKGASPQDQLRYETERSLAAILKSPQ